MPDKPKTVTGEWVEWDDVPPPEAVEVDVHPIRSGDVETAEEPSGADQQGG
jgi:hypothetical protein